jgi:alpha-tubulin suppressor-like RCC1 family protein
MYSVALTEDNEVYFWGDPAFRSASEVPIKMNMTIDGVRNIVQLSVGIEHTLLLTERGHIYGFGYNGKNI